MIRLPCYSGICSDFTSAIQVGLIILIFSNQNLFSGETPPRAELRETVVVAQYGTQKILYRDIRVSCAELARIAGSFGQRLSRMSPPDRVKFKKRAEFERFKKALIKVIREQGLHKYARISLEKKKVEALAKKIHESAKLSDLGTTVEKLRKEMLTVADILDVWITDKSAGEHLYLKSYKKRIDVETWMRYKKLYKGKKPKDVAILRQSAKKMQVEPLRKQFFAQAKQMAETQLREEKLRAALIDSKAIFAKQKIKDWIIAEMSTVKILRAEIIPMLDNSVTNFFAIRERGAATESNGDQDGKSTPTIAPPRSVAPAPNDAK